MAGKEEYFFGDMVVVQIMMVFGWWQLFISKFLNDLRAMTLSIDGRGDVQKKLFLGQFDDYPRLS